MMRCTWCKAPLVTRAGEPRWDVFGGDRSSRLAFVCYGRCRRVAVMREAGRR